MGLTLPGFVESSKVIASLPSLGLLTLAGMTPDNYSKAYYEIANLKISPRRLAYPLQIINRKHAG